VEQDRIEHVTRHVEFMVHYARRGFTRRLCKPCCKRAGAARGQTTGQAKSLIENEGLPIWLKLAPEVRHAILRFHGAVATRNDLGTLASLQNKFVRLALDRLPLSMAEFLDRMPAAVESAVAGARSPDTETLCASSSPSVRRCSPAAKRSAPGHRSGCGRRLWRRPPHPRGSAE